MGVPNPASIQDSDTVLHFVAVGDQAFPLTKYLMTPYPENNKLSLDQRIFNYRLSRARRIIENAFGILPARWRILRRTIDANVETIEAILKATICLHNYLIKNKESTYFHKSIADRQTSNGDIILGTWRNDTSENNLFQNLSKSNQTLSSRKAVQVNETNLRSFLLMKVQYLGNFIKFTNNYSIMTFSQLLTLFIFKKYIMLKWLI